jgi:hypothetical protein
MQPKFPTPLQVFCEHATTRLYRQYFCPPQTLLVIWFIRCASMIVRILREQRHHSRFGLSRKASILGPLAFGFTPIKHPAIREGVCAPQHAFLTSTLWLSLALRLSTALSNRLSATLVPSGLSFSTNFKVSSSRFLTSEGSLNGFPASFGTANFNEFQPSSRISWIPRILPTSISIIESNISYVRL